MGSAEYSIAYLQKKDFDSSLYREVSEQAKEVLDGAKNDEVIMLQVKFNSPVMSITKALPATEENLSKIAKID